MSFQSQFEVFRNNSRVVFNDRFIGDQGAHELSVFLKEHRKVESLEIKSNDISPIGFIEIFEALKSNPGLRQLNIEYNNLGQNDYDDWQYVLSDLIGKSNHLQRINFSNNKITGTQFQNVIPAIANSKTLKLIQARYNQLTYTEVDMLTASLKNHKNDTLLFVELSGNKIKRDSIDALQGILKVNRSNNPISKDKLMMTGSVNGSIIDKDPNMSSFYQGKNRAIDDLSKDNVIKHLQDILDQNRKDTAQMKIRLQRELSQLQKRQKNDARQQNELDNKCNQLTIKNRSIKFELDRAAAEYQQMQRDQQHHMRLHEEKLREANKQLQDLQVKYEDIEDRMCKEHEAKIKEIAREWENRLRVVEEKIRTAENDNNVLDNETKKQMQKRERLRIQYIEEENLIRSRVEDEQAQRYGFKLSALQIKLREIQQTREKYIRRNQQLIYELQSTQANSISEVGSLEQELSELKAKQQQFISTNKDFLTRNEVLKGDINLREITIEKLQEEINRLNEQIELKKTYNREQVENIISNNMHNLKQKEEEKRLQIQRLNQLEATLRHAQLENAKLRQQYALLAQKLQLGLGKAIQKVFAQNKLF